MKISVITICYNNLSGLKKTIESVINQSYKDIEYIIIDGGSEDGSVELIKQYQAKFPITHISEHDEGIYDAMNKGIKLSSGDWINFMNAGDNFYEEETITKSVPYLEKEFDIIYGNTEIVYKEFKTIKDEPSPKDLWMGRIPHQSAFIKSSVMKKYFYNKNNPIVADLEFFLNVYYNDGKIKKINQTIASFAKDGISEKMDSQVIIDAEKTVKKFKNNFKVFIYYSLLKIKPLIKRLLPRNIFKLIKIKTNL